MVIDFHCHLGKNYKPLSFQKTEEITADAVIAAQNEAGIDFSTAIPFPAVYPEDLWVSNGIMFALKHDRLIPFIWLNPYLLYSRGFRGVEEALLVEKIKKSRVRGLKIHPVCDAYYPSVELLSPVFEIARACSIPVLWHTGWASFGEARFVEVLAKAFPNVTIIIGHMMDNNSPEVVRRNDNVYLETSYCSGPRRLAGAVNLLGSEKILFGSDFPVNDMVFQKTLILRAKISDKEKENILGLNAKRLLKI